MSEVDLHTTEVNDGVAASPDVGAAVLGPGAQLAAQRQARGWSVEQVADQLNLAARQIQALEADNYAALPGMVIARGFVRAYAKLLKVDAAPLVAMMAGEVVAPLEPLQLRRALSGSFSESSLPSMGSRSNGMKWLGILLVLVVLFIAVLSAQRLGYLSLSQDGLSGKIENGIRAFSSVHLTNPIANDQNSLPESSVLVPPVAAPASSELLMAESLNADAASQAPAPSQIQSPAPPPAPAAAVVADKDLLVLNMHEDSWVEVRRADDSVLISRVMKAGTTESLTVTQPILLTIGNAAGVDATLRGKALELKDGSKNNVARLNVK